MALRKPVPGIIPVKFPVIAPGFHAIWDTGGTAQDRHLAYREVGQIILVDTGWQLCVYGHPDITHIDTLLEAKSRYMDLRGGAPEKPRQVSRCDGWILLSVPLESWDQAADWARHMYGLIVATGAGSAAATRILNPVRTEDRRYIFRMPPQVAQDFQKRYPCQVLTAP